MTRRVWWGPAEVTGGLVDDVFAALRQAAGVRRAQGVERIVLSRRISRIGNRSR
jgi:hypothetical protein